MKAKPNPCTTDELGKHLVPHVNTSARVASAGREWVSSDRLDFIDDGDPSNLRLHMASGAVFVLRIIREG